VDRLRAYSREIVKGNTAKLLRGKNLLKRIWKWYQDQNASKYSPEGLDGHLSCALNGAAKLWHLLDLVANNVVLNQKKLAVFCTLPGQMDLVVAVLKTLNISAAVYHAGLGIKEKSVLKREFNGNDERMVLIDGYAIMACGPNLQHKCHHVIFMDTHTINSIRRSSCVTSPPYWPKRGCGTCYSEGSNQFQWSPS